MIPCRPTSTSHPRAFTLIELLVSISIIAILIAILLPALQGARYSAQVVTCKATLRGISTAMLVYVNDFDQHLPEVADEVLTSGSFLTMNRRRTWQMTNDTGTPGDLRPIYQEYLGASLDDAFKCPLATEWFAERDQDSNGLSNYMLYPSNQWRAKHFGFAEPGGYTDPDVGFQMSGTSPFRFGVLASDQAMTRYGSRMLSGHPAQGGSNGEIGNGTNDTLGYDLGTGLSAPINYVNRDGAVSTYLMSYDSFTSSEFAANSGGGAASRGMLLPVELGW